MSEAIEYYNVTDSSYMVAMANVECSGDRFPDDEDVTFMSVPGREGRQYVCWGADDQLPYNVIKLVGKNQVMSQNKLFNVLTCYGAGLKYMDYQTKAPTRDPEIRRFIMQNSFPAFFLEQATDMKYYFFAVAVIILSKDGSQIVQVRHKEACYCRFEKADNTGHIRNIYYANWSKSGLTAKEIEQIPLLDMHDPLGDLEIQMGRRPGPDGTVWVRTKARKFAVVCRFPTPGLQYYPVPYYTSIFRDCWYDIMHLIGIGKRAKLKNHSSVKYLVEVHNRYWEDLCKEEGISDPIKKRERIVQERKNIRDFVAGIENSGKLWISGYYVDPSGHEIHAIKISVINAQKEGGDWSEDIQESSNMCCYGDNIHPNLVGATPGKSQSNNSGSDKRELFTLKQSLEIAFHDLMQMVHDVIIYYNGWQDKVYPEIPMILLTTLDQHTDAKTVTANENDLNNE